MSSLLLFYGSLFIVCFCGIQIVTYGYLSAIDVAYNSARTHAVILDLDCCVILLKFKIARGDYIGYLAAGCTSHLDSQLHWKCEGGQCAREVGQGGCTGVGGLRAASDGLGGAGALSHRSPPTRRTAQVLRESRREPRAVPLEDGGVSARPRPPAVMPRWPER
ncbi:unnamed protein product, partial [Brenthis ino]